jgi:hypothetical protein
MKLLLNTLFIFSLAMTLSAAEEIVGTSRVPNNGIQPQIFVASSKVVHLIYYKGNANNGNLFYSTRDKKEGAFSKGIQVNSQGGSAIAIGTIRGTNMAVTSKGVLHIVWNGSSKAQPKGPLDPFINKDNPNNGTPLLYARLEKGAKAFTKQKNLLQSTFGLDGGASVGADDKNVYVVWHAATKGSGKGEKGRSVWISASEDGGKTFSKDRVIYKSKKGICACCGMDTIFSPSGKLWTIFRNVGSSGRDMVLLSSTGKGKKIKLKAKRIDTWKTRQCPMSSTQLFALKKEVYLTWENKGQVFFKKASKGKPIAVPGNANGRKHPRIAVNSKGLVLVAWTEGTGWKRGGSLHWQVFDTKGKPTKFKGEKGGIPVWSFPAVYVRPNDEFMILY